MNINHKIEVLTNRFQSNSPFKIAEGLGIYIHHEHLGNILGYYSKHYRIPIIHINELAEKDHQTFICAHELGHAILHPNQNTSFLKRKTLFSTDAIEIEANAFAVSLLFLSECETCTTIHDVLELYGVPEQVLKKSFDRLV